MEGTKKRKKAAMKFKKGVLFLADVVDYTPQANRLGDQKTAAFNEHFEKKIRELTKIKKGIFIRRIGDAVLIFFEDEKPFLEFVIELRVLSRTRGLDLYDFFADLRMVAHYGNFSFETIEESISDLIGPEGIKVFRIEKYAGEYDVIITGSLLGVIRNALDEKNISFTNLGTVKLKGFDEDAFLYKLNFPVRGKKAASTFLCVKMEALEAETRVIPVFGDLYPAMNMEDNFINLDIKTGDVEKWSGAGKYFPKREMEREWEEREGMPGIDLKMKREKERESPGYVDVKTLYNLQNHGIILGLPGSGKTTILKYFAFREFKENRKILEEDKKRVVLFIPCRNIPGYSEWQRLRFRDEKKAESAFNVETLLFYLTYCFLFNKQEVKQDKEKQELRIAEKLVHQAYNSGRLTLLIDALDEAPGKNIKEDMIACVKELFTDLSEGPRKGKANRVFLTSRYSEREMYFSGKGADMLRPQFEVRSLDMEQLREMARYFYGEETELYKEFDDIVWREEIAAKVGGTPVTALLVIAYYEIFRKFDTRYHMYNVIVIFILVRVWKQIKEKHFNKDMRIFFKEARSKKVLKEEKNAREIYDALSLLSYEHMDEGTVINEEDIAGVFELFAREKVEEKEAEAEAEQWLKQMKEDHLLVSTGANEYVFIHNTVMEYLAARFIVEKSSDSRYLEEVFKIEAIHPHLSQKSAAFFETEILPIAVGSGIQTGVNLLRFARSKVEQAEDEMTQSRFYLLALKSLAELESFIERQYRRKRLKFLQREIEEEMNTHRDAVDWIYTYLGSVILSKSKTELNSALTSLKNISRLSRSYFLERYLDYELFIEGDEEVVSLREKLLYQVINREWVDNWLVKHRKQQEPEVTPVEKTSLEIEEAGLNLLTMDSKSYHPEDKNFRYYQNYSGKELAGFLGSPNLKHESMVICFAFSPEGKYIISGSVDFNVKLWELDTGKEIRAFKGHYHYVYSVGFSPDGNYIISGSLDSTVKLWELKTGKEIHTFRGHHGCVNSLAFSPDGNYIISGSSDNTLKLWELYTGKEVRTFKGHSNSVTSVAVSPEGNYIISGSWDSTIKLWELETGKEIRTFKGHKGSLYSLAFSSDGNYIISGSSDNTIKLWELETGKEIRTLKGHSKYLNILAFISDGDYIISGSTDGTVKLWELETGREVRTFKVHLGKVESPAFSPEGKYIISGSVDSTVKLWELETGKEICTFSGHNEPVHSVAFSPEGKYIISGSVDSTVKLWELETGKEIRTFKGHRDPVLSVAFSSGEKKGNFIISGSGDNTLKLWELDTGKEIHSFKGHYNSVWSVALSPEGNFVISGSSDNTLRLWELDTGKEIRTFKGHSNSVTSVAVSPEGNYIISGAWDSTVKLWELDTGKEIRTFKGHSWVNSVAFSSDGNYIISGSSDNTIKLWELETGKEIRTFKGHNHDVKSIAFNPDGNYIISGSKDYTLKLWDIQTGQCIKTVDLLWKPNEIKAMPEKPGVFATANGNGTVTLFDFREIIS